MNDTPITLQGWLGGDVDAARGRRRAVASFRLACTPTRFNRRTESWVDGADPVVHRQRLARASADNCAASLRRGDPVVVHGRLDAPTSGQRDGKSR